MHSLLLAGTEDASSDCGFDHAIGDPSPLAGSQKLGGVSCGLDHVFLASQSSTFRSQIPLGLKPPIAMLP